ncbi:hypothetical protein ACJMK2_022092 [Sinanodonta woodiana]|uniref:VWFA domain-containing protein n=1 Tax=Sinanodonta woodiana TaxID=1069815 RepID=A0ABD3TIY5_SINWO
MFTTAAVFSVVFSLAFAFLPNPFSSIGPNDYTHDDITQLGILQAVAKYFEKNPVPGCPCTAGSLSGIRDIDARKLYDGYYGGLVSEKRFQEAMDDIVKHNNKVDQDHPNEAVWHFNGEKIREANTKMQTLRDTLIQILNSTSPSYDAARELIGQYLHLLQMFYSNTNWVEMSGKQIYRPLGITGMPIMASAPPDFDTCRSCGLTLGTPCLSNLLVTSNLLTSGYRSGQDVMKPYKFGLETILGDEVFQDVLQLRPGASLVFVIDTTGSMGKDLAAVQQKTQEIVRETYHTVNQPYNYILVTFNDPGNLTTVQKTTEPDQIQQWLREIHVHGGDDCPEFSLTGIQAASTVAVPNSQIYVFTDATPKDPEKINYVTSLVTEKKLRVNFVVSGKC